MLRLFPRCTVSPSLLRCVQAARLQSTSTTASTGKLSSLTDQEVDDWLSAIKELRTEFIESEFLPAKSLAPPGAKHVDLLDGLKQKQAVVTEEQLQEYNRIKALPLPIRRDPVVQHVTNMIMRHGKKQKAEKAISRALYLVHTSIRKDPIEILKKALDDLAPLMVVKTFNTGVAKAALIPVPLNQRQRHRIAWKWILEGANKRVSSDFAVRLGEELISVYKGNSSGFEKRDQMHKTAIAHRAYIKLK